MKYCEAFRKDEEKWKTDQYVIPCQVQFHSIRRDWPNAGEGRGNRMKKLVGTAQGHYSKKGIWMAQSSGRVFSCYIFLLFCVSGGSYQSFYVVNCNLCERETLTENGTMRLSE